METYSQPNILFLRNIALNDFVPIEDLFYKQLKERCDNGPGNEEKITSPSQEPAVKMPKYFTTIEKWPKTTNLLCKRCSLRPWKTPVPVPTSMSYCVETRASKFSYNGICCSFVCAKSWIDTHVEETSKCDTVNMLRKIYFAFTGKNSLFIPAAPDYTEMDKYSGPSGITEAEFKKKIDNLEK